MENAKDIQYNRVKPWQIYAWSIHDVVANCFLFLMNFVLYLAIGEYAILTMLWVSPSHCLPIFWNL